ncbi:MAG: hypothetical protein PHV34_18735 [Verrucomicrobiae bacterium]|nr:hypothetical protein [Verrucomicrobiae bacterium]
MRSCFFHNFGLKLVAVFLAALVWLVINAKLEEKSAAGAKAGDRKVLPFLP